MSRLLVTPALFLTLACAASPVEPEPCVWPDDFSPLVQGRDTVGYFCVRSTVPVTVNPGIAGAIPKP